MAVNPAAVGVTGVYAAEAQMAAIESNITNDSNPNYSAESVPVEAIAGYGGAGAGVLALPTVRAQAPYLNSEISATESLSNYNQALSTATSAAQQVLAPSSGYDLSSVIQSMFNALTSLSASPADSTVRSTAITALQQFAETDQSMSASLTNIANGQYSQVSSLIAQVNQITGQIAQLNQQIVVAQATGQNAPALEDNRDGLIKQLAGLIGATGDAQGNVSIGGIPLVSGTSALTISTTGSGGTLTLQDNLASGVLPISASQIGGTLGGVLAGAASAVQLESQVNSFANSLATALNTQAASGYGLDGSTGTALFVVSGGGGPIAINPALTEQNLGAAATAAGLPGDGSNAAAMAALASNPNLLAAYPNSTPIQAFSQLASAYGITAQSAASGQQQAAASLQSLTQLKSSITGVSLNDQLTQLVQYQNELQACGRAIQAANDLTTFLVQNLN